MERRLFLPDVGGLEVSVPGFLVLRRGGGGQQDQEQAEEGDAMQGCLRSPGTWRSGRGQAPGGEDFREKASLLAGDGGSASSARAARAGHQAGAGDPDGEGQRLGAGFMTMPSSG